ncbi:MAG: cob(I)yrinic acid a,c-diamide adenosyltransferase [Myxococcales bacterium]
MKIYTKRGDRGETSLLGGEAASKASPRVCAYGDVDELNATLGVARGWIAPADGELDAILGGLQSSLFELGAELATPPAGPQKASTPIGEDDVARLERIIDRLQEALPPQKHFVLPSGSPAAAALHLARTVCRRAERSVVALKEAGEPVGSQALIFLNRLSDLLFVMARIANQRAGVADVPWIARRPG